MMPHKLLLITAMLIFNIVGVFAVDFWQRLDGPNGGMVNVIVSKGNQFIFAGSATDGVFRSSNNGYKWEQCNNGLEGSDISSMIVSKEGKIFASAYGTGIYSTTDEGNNWEKCFSINQNIPIGAMVYNKKNELFAGAIGYGVVKTVDNGITWDTITNGIGNVNISALACSHSGVLFAGTYNSGVYVSSDDGLSWAQTDTTNWKSKNVICLAITTNDWVFAGTTDSVYRSTDNGTHWKAVMNGVYDESIKSILVTTDTTIILGTLIKTYYTKDYGDSWQMVDLKYNLINVTALSQDSTGIIYAGNTSVGLFRSSDFGKNWDITTQGYSYVPVSKVIDYNGDIFTGSTTRLIHKYHNSVWSLVMYGEQVTGMNISPRGDLFIGTSIGGTFRTTDKGNTFKQATTVYNYGITHFLFDGGNNIFGSRGAGYTGNGGITYTNDYGNSWFPSTNGIGTRPVSALAYDSKGRITALADTGLFYSSDAAASWTFESTFPKKLRPVSLFIFDSTYITGTDSAGVYISNDYGISWINTLNQKKIVAMDRDLYGQIFAATVSNGIFQSDDNGKTFVKLPDLPLISVVYDIKCTDKHYLLVATDRGIFKSNQPTSVEIGKTKNNSGKFKFLQYHSNLNIVSESDVNNLNVEIYNLFGQKIKSMDWSSNPSISIDLNCLVTGVYLFVVKNNTIILSTNLINVVR